MKPSSKWELVVLTYLMEKRSRQISEIQAEFKISEVDDFQFKQILNDLVKKGSITPISSENPTWEITELGKIHLKDLELDRYDDENKIPHIVRTIIIVVVILAFLIIFRKKFHS